MSANTSVRPARAEDAAAVARIYNQGIADRQATFETEPRTVQQMRERLLEHGDSYPNVVVERNGQVVAWGGTAPYSPRPCYAGIGACSVYVERDAAGTGRIALDGLIAVCEARGFWKLVSRVFPENAASRAMCRASGFREVGVYQRHGMLDGHWRDCVIVERLLGPALA